MLTGTLHYAILSAVISTNAVLTKDVALAASCDVTVLSLWKLVLNVFLNPLLLFVPLIILIETNAWLLRHDTIKHILIFKMELSEFFFMLAFLNLVHVVGLVFNISSCLNCMITRYMKHFLPSSGVLNALLHCIRLSVHHLLYLCIQITILLLDFS